MEEANRKRITAKSWLTRATNKLRQLLDSGEFTQISLVAQIEEFEKRLGNLDEAQSLVEEHIEIEKLEDDIEAAAQFRAEKLVTLLAAREKQVSTAELDNLSQEKTESSTSERVQPSGQVSRLPKLELPKFSGEYTEWQTFWDKFRAVIDSNNSIPTVNKFTSLSLTETNYSTAKTLLQTRFGRPERIIFSHIQRLLQTNLFLTSKESSLPAHLWRLHDEITTQVRSLENLGVGGESYGVILTPLILHQLPNNIRLEWARVDEGKEGDLGFLLKFLHEEIQRRERSQTFGVTAGAVGPTTTSPSEARSGSLGGQRSRPRQNMRKGQGSATALLSGSGSKRTPLCVFCHGGHFSDQCQELNGLDLEARKNKIRKLGLCFVCLGNHLAKDCSKVCFHCKGAHHAVLCLRQMKKEVEGSGPVGYDVGPAHVGYTRTKNATTIMQVVKTKIAGAEVNVMFDSGSDRSFVTLECARKLDLQSVGKESLAYCCFGENESRKGERDVFELRAFGERVRLVGMNQICSSMFRAPVPTDLLERFIRIPFCEDFEKGRSITVDILIGLDWYWPLIRDQKIGSGGLVAQETVFGWILSGSYSPTDGQKVRQVGSVGQTQKSQVLFCQTELSDGLIRNMWDLDTIGISPSEESAKSKVLEDFEREVRFENGRYTVRLPWKDEETKTTLVENRVIAERRLQGLIKRLEKDPSLKTRYNDVIADLEERGIVEEVPTEEMVTKFPTFYLPHHPVVKESSRSTKVRPVFDASCKGVNGISLNDCMEKGPKMIPDLVKILLRFRRWQYGLSADIQNAFLMIGLHTEDKDVHRFLWNVNDQIRTMRFTRVTFGNAASPFLLNATVQYHLARFDECRTVKELTSPERWHFCPGKENPADLLTRGISAREMTNSNMWLHGPAWLNESQPRSDEEIPDWTREEEDEDARETVLVMTPVEGTKNLLEYDRFSDFGKLVRVVTWVLRFTTNCRPHQERRSSSELSPGELENGGITLLRCIQRERYGEEIEQLISGREVKGGSPISRLSPFIGKDGLLRMQGRLAFASSLLYDEKHPITLPKCHLTLLLVKNKHYMMKHAGVDTLVTAIRNNFWIVSVRTLAKKVCRSCIHCQRQDARACKQAMAPLPEDRVKKSPPFSVIGIDHAGPLFCSDTSNRKLYILLFTCAVVRAVHLELVASLSLEDFILAFKRFVARRGHPSIIYSDNAQTFKAAHKVLQRELGYMGLDWKFSAPLAPWWGGFWERLVRSVKSALRKSLGNTRVSRVQLDTTLQQVEACINSRPLIYVGDDCNPLTPSHFLIGRGSALSPSMVEEYIEKVSDLELREKCETEAVSQFWEIWQDVYIKNLPTLTQGGQKCDIEVGSMVLVREDGKPRLQWPLGVITKTFVGRDGLIRAVELKTKKGHFIRALQRLHKLELVSEVKGGGQSESDPKTTVEDRANACTSDDKKLQNSPVYTRAGRQRRAPKKLDL